MKVKTSPPTAWNGIIKWAPEPEWAKLTKLTGIFTLNHKSRFDPKPRIEYVHAALRQAKYEILPDDGSYYGEIPECKGVRVFMQIRKPLKVVAKNCGKCWKPDAAIWTGQKEG